MLTIAAVGLAATITACSGDDDVGVSGEAGSTSSSVSSSVSSPTDPSTAASAPSISTTAGAAGENPGPPDAAPGPRLADGRPATFVGVTVDDVAVEVDTATGEIVREIASTGNEGGGAATTGNVVVEIWWDPASRRAIVSECCEPAAGRMIPMTVGDPYSTDGPGLDAWDAAIDPSGTEVLVTGYVSALSPVADVDPVTIGEMDLDGTGRRPAWLRDRRGVVLARNEEFDGELRVGSLEIVELDAANEVIIRRRHELGMSVADVDVRADGLLVVLLSALPGANFGDTALVVDPDDGSIVTEFGLAAGSASMGYDTTGTFLLFVDGDGTVRWQGRGGSGTLATGFLSADW